MTYREIIAVCSQIHTKHINTLRGQNVGLLNVKLAVYIVTTGFNAVTRSTSLQNGLDTQWQFGSVAAGACCGRLIQD